MPDQTLIIPYDYSQFDLVTAEFVREREQAIRVRMTTTVKSAIGIGKLLIEVKERLPHGQFGKWHEHALGISASTAARFMRAASKLVTVTNLESIAPTALYELLSDNTPPDVREEILERAGFGETVRPADVREAVLTHTAADADLLHQRYAGLRVLLRDVAPDWEGARRTKAINHLENTSHKLLHLYKGRVPEDQRFVQFAPLVAVPSPTELERATVPAAPDTADPESPAAVPGESELIEVSSRPAPRIPTPPTEDELTALLDSLTATEDELKAAWKGAEFDRTPAHAELLARGLITPVSKWSSGSSWVVGYMRAVKSAPVSFAHNPAESGDPDSDDAPDEPEPSPAVDPADPVPFEQRVLIARLEGLRVQIASIIYVIRPYDPANLDAVQVAGARDAIIRTLRLIADLDIRLAEIDTALAALEESQAAPAVAFTKRAAI